jgi:hypothetical protein
MPAVPVAACEDGVLEVASDVVCDIGTSIDDVDDMLLFVVADD